MECNVITYFKDDRGDWHQPGTLHEFSEDEARKYEKMGALRIVRTQMLKTPATRKRRGRPKKKEVDDGS